MIKSILFVFLCLFIACPLFAQMDRERREVIQRHARYRALAGYREQPIEIFLRYRNPTTVFWQGDGYYPFYYSGIPYYDVGNDPHLWCIYINGVYECAQKLEIE